VPEEISKKTEILNRHTGLIIARCLCLIYRKLRRVKKVERPKENDMTYYILLEYKTKDRSGCAGDIAVWLFTDRETAQAKMTELTKNDLPLSLYESKELLYFGE